PTTALTCVIPRLVGVLAGVIAKAVDGYMPADQETIRYTGISGHDAAGRWYLNREILGGGSGGRYYADGSDTIHVVPESRNLPVEFVETRFPVRVEALGLAPDSGGAGTFRGGLGYRKDIRVLEDASFMSVADRSILSCWGVRGGRAGTPFRGTIDPGGPRGRAGRAVRSEYRPRRPPRGGPARPGRRRAGGGGRGHPHRDDGGRRLGRPAGPRPCPGGPGRPPGQGHPRRGPRRLWRGAPGRGRARRRRARPRPPAR